MFPLGLGEDYDLSSLRARWLQLILSWFLMDYTPSHTPALPPDLLVWDSQLLCSWASLEEKVAGMLHVSLGKASQRRGWGDWAVSRMGATVLSCHHFDTLVLLANTARQHLQTAGVGQKGENQAESSPKWEGLQDLLFRVTDWKMCCKCKCCIPKHSTTSALWDQSSFLCYVVHPGNAATFIIGVSSPHVRNWKLPGCSTAAKCESRRQRIHFFLDWLC